MVDISVGAVGAALIAGLVSLLGLIIGKEQKVSEFRQSWIDELRKCLVSYLVNINAICDNVRLHKAGKPFDNATQIANFKLLNEASNGIKLRINENEDPAKSLLSAMTAFESMAESNDNLTPEKIRTAEIVFLENSRSLLKFEWERVKRGEKIFVWTKRIVCFFITLMICILFYICYIHYYTQKSKTLGDADFMLVVDGKRPNMYAAPKTVSFHTQI